MSLDINIDRIKEAAKIAGKYYDNKTFNHVVRVVDYVVKNPAIPIYLQEDCVCVSLICMIYLKTQIMIQKINLYILEKRCKKFQNLKI